MTRKYTGNVDNMRTIYVGNGFLILKDGYKYLISWPQGPFSQITYYEINEQLAERAQRSEEDGYEVMVFAETGNWPQKDKEMYGDERSFA